VIPLLKLGTRVARSNLGRNARPFKLTLIVTWTCDARCRMCNIWKRDKKGVMTLDEVRAFFAKNPHFSWINLSGGEIWTRDDAAEVALAAVEGSPDLFLLDFPTTGQRTDAIVDGVRRLLATRLPKLLVTVSLDGPREVHEDVRGVKGAFDRALATFCELRKLRSRRFGCFLGMTLSQFNRGRLFETVEAVRAEIPDAELREFHVNVAQESAHYYQNEGMGRAGPDALTDLGEFVRRRGHAFHPVAWLERRYQKLVPEFLATGRTPLSCKALASSVFVDARWNVYPCSMYDAPLGNLRELGFDLGAVWDGERTVTLQREIASRACPNCWTPCEAYQTILGNLLR
jgi:MoaA/NifB/PqqE/SkfB family radical SAM enzyme